MSIQISPVHIITEELHAWSALAKHQTAMSRQRKPQHMLGQRLSNHRGRGLEFAEVRAYQPGDDIRSIDWRVTARKGKTHTRLYHEEREQPIMIVCDLRSSMAFGSKVRFKSVLAAHMAVISAWIACFSGNRTGFLLLTDDGIVSHKPLLRERAVDLLINTLAQSDPARANDDTPTSGSAATMEQAVAQLSLLTRPGFKILMISDFADWQKLPALSGLRVSREIALLHCHDPLDEFLPPAGEYVISDGRRRAVIYSGNQNQRRKYQSEFAHKTNYLKQIAGGYGYFPFATELDSDTLIRQIGEIMR